MYGRQIFFFSTINALSWCRFEELGTAVYGVAGKVLVKSDLNIRQLLTRDNPLNHGGHLHNN